MNHPPAAPASPPSRVPLRATAWWVVCLCAQWCRVCGEYQTLFDALAQAHPETRFVWVDVEDEEGTVGDLDVETFPTLLIADGEFARFLGPLLPQAPVLARLLASLQGAAPVAAAVSPQAQALWERIRTAHAL